MNSHLNVFKTYTKENREYQLENDLTRSFAICMQEDALFFHEILKLLIDDPDTFELMFGNVELENNISIDIQVNTRTTNSFSKLIAVSLSDVEMVADNFWKQSDQTVYDPICDIVVTINETLIVIEAKRDNIDCTNQLYNQIYNLYRTAGLEDPIKEVVSTVDLNWKKLMKTAVKVLSFQRAVNGVNRFTSDFVALVKAHNPQWLPETPIAALSNPDYNTVLRRVGSAINELDIQEDFTKVEANDRLGLIFNKPWAQEMLFNVVDHSKERAGALIVSIYPGNTKSQGHYIFSRGLNVVDQIFIEGREYTVEKSYHIKLTSFQRFFTGLWFTDADLKKDGLYSKENFDKYAGRNKKDNGRWRDVEIFFDEYFKEEFNWRAKLSWENLVLNTSKTQFDLSFGYELAIVIEFSELKQRDQNASSLNGLKGLIESCYSAFENDLVK